MTSPGSRNEGQTIFISGAGAGLGRTYALQLAQEGANLVLNDIEAEACEETRELVEKAGSRALVQICDVTDAAAIENAVARALEHFGRIDGVVCNAGSLRDRTFAKMPLEDFRFIVEVHLMGTVNLLKPIWPKMQQQDYGRVVLTTSTSALYGNFGQTNYDAAKLGIVGLCKSLALEGAKSDITVNCIAPIAYTRLGEGIFPEALRSSLGPEHISHLVCYLLSRSGGATTGKVIEAGGGKIALARTMRTDFVRLHSEGDETATIRALTMLDPANAPASAPEAFTAHLEATLDN